MTKWLDDDEMRAWRGVVDTMAGVLAATEADLVAAHGLAAGDYAVLVNLSEAPDRAMRMCDLACRLHLSPSGLTRRLDGLVRQGLVRRVPTPDDRRVMLAELTSKGFTVLEDAAPDHVESVRRHFFSHLNKGQIRQLGSILGRLEADEDSTV